MRLTLARILVVTGMCGTAMAVIPAANASGGDTMAGGCRFDTGQQQTLTGNSNVGFISDLSVTRGADGMPIGATVSCAISVNGVIDQNTISNYSGPGVQAGINTISFTAADVDWVALVYRVVYADGTDTGWVYPCLDCGGWPPQVVFDVLDLVNGVVIAFVDPQVCPVLAAHPGAYGPIAVAADGDVYVNDPLGIFAGSPIYDCPPYNNF